ncbi:McbB family protein [Paenibacillus sp. FSL H7-0350]|uniref:McbB family protein n=1 Tax=Paenibacillus sp. FSL H7-0350 TaxID=2975345 RepID=UPI003158BD2E
MNYKINKYILFRLEDGKIVVQNQDSIVTITEPSLIALLVNWDEDQIESTSDEKLKEIFHDDTIEAINFLKDYFIIIEERPKTVNVKKLIIASNDSLTSLKIYELLHEDYKKNINVELYSVDDLPECEENELTIVFLNPYNKKIAKRIVERQNRMENSMLLCTYIYHNNFYMDCLFSPSWKVPCHQCHMGHIESTGLVEENQGLTYQNMIDSLYSENENFMVQVPITAIQNNNIINVIVNNVSSFLGNMNTTNFHKEDLTTCSLLDLKTLKKYKDTSIHWELCNCYES